ncbi:MAG: glycoside hydrolase family 13 protein [Eubacteriales bacterium]
MVFNSRNSFYKHPCGAVPHGAQVTFKIQIPAEVATTSATLCIAKDGEAFLEYPMKTGKSATDPQLFTVKFTADQGCAPYWYHFRLETPAGVQYVSKDFGGLGRIIDKPYSFQQTVYDDTYQIPSWYGEGITYNVFPDRFHRTRTPRKMDGRVVHKNWNELPVYLPNEEGEVLNNDFFGGNLKGVMEKLDYLKSLGVSTIYLNPIFQAYSNHRYDTGDYKTIDKYLGTEADFARLCKKAKKMGMKIILDGVFSHTGFDSLYFNGKGSYPSVGAYQSEDSPYASWYTFKEFPDEYAAWWGIYTLPEVNEMNEDYVNYIIDGDNSVIKKWLRLGASGYRLDVADELPDEFIQKLNIAAKSVNPEAIVIGEVWEDASTKESYDKRRQYVYGQYLDSVMNYVMKDALIHYMKDGYAQEFRECVETLQENYPPNFFHSLMNIVGTHDTARILTVLVGEHFETKTERAEAVLTPEQYDLGIKLQKLISLIQFTMPGSPCIYYGDEVGMEGYEDPLNRKTFPWGQENQDLLEWYRYLGKLRKDNPCLVHGDVQFSYAKDDVIVYRRRYKRKFMEIFINRSEHTPVFTIGDTEYTMEPWSYIINTK